jgi:hypothetical protein
MLCSERLLRPNTTLTCLVVAVFIFPLLSLTSFFKYFSVPLFCGKDIRADERDASNKNKSKIVVVGSSSLISFHPLIITAPRRRPLCNADQHLLHQRDEVHCRELLLTPAALHNAPASR